MKTNLGSTYTIYKMLEDSGTGHLVLGPGLTVVWANPAFERFIGMKKDELVGRTVMDVFVSHAPDILYNYSEIQPAFAEAYAMGRKIGGLQAHVKPGNGREERWMELWSHPIAHGEFAGGRIEYFYDITENKRNEQRLGLLTSAVEQTADGVSLIGMDGKLLFANEAFARMHGYSLDETLGSHIHFFRRKVDTLDFQKEIRIIEKTGSIHGETVHAKKSGEEFPVQVDVTIVRDPDGKKKGFLCTCRDITEQSRSEKELQESRRTLLTLMSNLPGMAYRCQNNPAWTMEFVSAGCTALTGYQAEELQFNKLLSYNDLIHLDDRNQVWDYVQSAVQNREPFKLNYRILTKDGKLKWVWEQGQAVYSDDGELLALEGFITDITERKRVEDALRESEGKFRRLAETTNAIIFIYQEAKLIYANPAAVKVTGYTAEDMDHMDFWEIIHPDQRDEVRLRGMSRLGGIEVPSRYETKILSKAGDTVWIDYAGTTIEYGGVPAILGTAFEITERKLAENRLRAATRELRQDRQKLSEKNTALKQILEHLENERQEFKQEISQEIENAVSPYLRRLKAELGDENKELKALEENLQAIIRKDIDLFKERYIRLTPRELEICDMIRKSLSSKQISQELNLSVATVQKHREQIRKKLAITNKSINLGSYLRSHRAI